MGPIHKRKHAEVAGGSARVGGPHDARKFKKPRTYPRKGNSNPATENAAKVDSTSVLKNRIRDLKRLLSHIDNDADSKMPANIRIDRERELETCEHELAEKLIQQRETNFRNKIISKYHHIRFFERQRATRNIKRLQKQLAALDDESEKTRLQQMLQNAEVDLNYTIYYPLLKSYVSLFPKPKKDGSPSTEDASTVKEETSGPGTGPKGNIEMWKAVEKAMEDGTLEALRNSREGVTIPTKKDPKREKAEKQKQKQNQGKAQTSAPAPANGVNSEDEDSDGGFFE
ncbi:hypothetical protein DM02DRAFT_658173 [Periconia macrospinosa]|uniref:rRNA-processing protein EFG1 n=1 Tax=Periconia macrospinosa TaxID=97972 RepID=A0A2V1DIA1_9PLEO|nr:hypothetical protein DM02DRAFT_658173 [Periconia macrospinosa]